MSTRPRNVYLRREIDDLIIGEACQWNNKPNGEHAHWIHLKYKPDTGSHEILKHLVEELPVRGFRPIYLDAKERLSPEIPGPLSWSIYKLISARTFRRITRAFGDFRRMPAYKKLAVVVFGAISIPLVMLGVEAKNYIFNFSPSKMSFRDFWSVYLPQQWVITPVRTLLDLFGIAGLLAFGLTMYRALVPRPLRWDEDTSPRFADGAGYLKTLQEIKGNLPFAILIDNAVHLSLAEGEVINHLLRTAEFRGVFISVGLPRNLRLYGIRQRVWDVPKLPAEILEIAQANDERVRNRVAEQLAKDEDRQEGVIGPYEWTAFCALVDRRWIGADEMKRLYAEVAGSSVLPLIGLPGPHPAEAPETKLREETAAPESFDEAYCRIEQAEIAEDRPELLAKVQFMLMSRGLSLIDGPGIWREWPPDQVRTVLVAAEHASDLADGPPPDEILINILSGDADSKLKLLCRAMHLLVTAAEIRRAHGNVLKANDYLQSASRWYGALENTIGEELQTAFFYQWWTSFWLSCEPQDREELRRFEASHPGVREHNAWKILSGYENYLTRLPLWEAEPANPGPKNPALANIRSVARLKDELLRIHGQDRDEAAKSAAFDLGEVYDERFVTFEGLSLLWTWQELAAKRDPARFEPAKDVFTERVALLRGRTRPDWLGDSLLLDYESLWIDYWRLINFAISPDNVSRYESERTALRAKCGEVRETALLLGFRSVVLRSSDMLGWVLMGEGSAQNLEHMKLIVDAEPYFQEVLDIEDSLGWCIYSPEIFQKRFDELSKLNQPSVVDDTIALYKAVKRAGFPPAVLRSHLVKACLIVANNGVTKKHHGEQASLHEEEAAMLQTTPEDRAGWIKKTMEEQVIYSFTLAADGWWRAGEPGEAERVLARAQEVLKQAETRGADDDGIREARVSISLRHALLADDRGDHDEYTRLLMECWAATHPGDTEATFMIRMLISSESSIGVLGSSGSVDSFSEQSFNPFFAPDIQLLSKHQDGLSRFHWRFLQFLTHARALQSANDVGFFRAVLNFGQLAVDFPLEDDCRTALLQLLKQAGEFFESEQASNANEQQAIRLRGALDPSPPPDLQDRLAEIEEEDRQLNLREQELKRSIKHSNWLEEFPRFDFKIGATESNEINEKHLADSLTVVNKAKALLAIGFNREALDLLLRRAVAVQQDRVLPIDLVMYHLWVNATPPQERELLRRRLNTLVEAFVAQRFGAGRTDLIEILRQRFEELDPWGRG